MEKSTGQGMQTFDQSLSKLYKEGQISLDEALKNADSKNNLGRITLEASKGSGDDQSLYGLSLVDLDH